MTLSEGSRQLKQILTFKQFAQKIGKSERHVQRLISVGEGPPIVRTGVRSVGIEEDDGDAWIAARRVVPPGWQDGKDARGRSAPGEAPRPARDRPDEEARPEAFHASAARGRE